MSEGDFSLLRQLGISVPDASVKEVQTTSNREGYYRVVTPCRRPPLKGNMSTEQSTMRRTPTAPLADYAGEVITVKGRKNQADIEYLIYNARVPSIRAINAQLIEEKRRRHAEEAAFRMSPSAGILQHRKCDDAARRRLLEHLQNVNKEQAQRKVEERGRERQRRLEREALELKAISDLVAKEKAAVAVKKQVGRESVQRASLEAMERKRQEASEVNNRPAALDYVAFPWSDARRTSAKRRAECLSLMEVNRELAEKAKRERQKKQMEERARENAALAEVKAKIEEENRNAREKKQRLYEQQRSASVETQKRKTPILLESRESGVDWFPRSNSNDEGKRRERHRKLMAENREIAEDARKRRAEDAERQIYSERQMIQEAQQACEKDRQRELAERRRQRDIYTKAVVEAAEQRSARRQTSPEYGSYHFIADEHSRNARTRELKKKSYYEGLKKEIDAAREARLETKEREAAWERRLLEMSEVEAKRSAEKEWEKTTQKREGYRRALDEQIKSRKAKEEHQGPIPHRGPERKVLYRCPVTGELLPPEQFGVVSTYRHGTKWIV